MVRLPNSIEESIKKFIDAVGRRYHINAAYLYGSQAKGTAKSWSDIDVAVVSSDFSDDLFEERLALMHISAYIDDRIEPRPFNMETFNENDPIVWEIQQNGIQLL